MRRRVALKNMATAVGGLIILPAWASGWNKATVLPIQPYLSPRQDELLAEIVETFIPATDTPGAKALNVHTFIQKMIADCYEEEVQQNLVKGLDIVEDLARQSFSKSFGTCDATQRIDVLTRMEQAVEPDRTAFYSLIKRLTIKGYTTSEYVMTNLTNYQMVPGHYYGCVPVPVK